MATGGKREPVKFRDLTQPPQAVHVPSTKPYSQAQTGCLKGLRALKKQTNNKTKNSSRSLAGHRVIRDMDGGSGE